MVVQRKSPNRQIGGSKNSPVYSSKTRKSPRQKHGGRRNSPTKSSPFRRGSGIVDRALALGKKDSKLDFCGPDSEAEFNKSKESSKGAHDLDKKGMDEEFSRRQESAKQNFDTKAVQLQQQHERSIKNAETKFTHDAQERQQNFTALQKKQKTEYEKQKESDAANFQTFLKAKEDKRRVIQTNCDAIKTAEGEIEKLKTEASTKSDSEAMMQHAKRIKQQEDFIAKKKYENEQLSKKQLEAYKSPLKQKMDSGNSGQCTIC